MSVSVNGIIPVDSAEVLEGALRRPGAFLYKHSPQCWISLLAEREVRRYAERNPATPVFQIDVLRSRALSERAAEALGVPHASPQIILVTEGEPAWWATHGSVRASMMVRASQELQEAP